MYPTDETLVAGCLANDPAAWVVLFTRYHGRLVAMATHLLWRSFGRREQAEELAAQTWLALVERGGRALRYFDPARGALEQFLLGCVRQEIQLAFRQRGRRIAAASLRNEEWIPDRRALPPRWALAEFLKALTPRERQYFEVHLLGEPGPRIESPVNRRRLKSRVRRKLAAYLYPESR
jgi:hypothetical protein